MLEPITNFLPKVFNKYGLMPAIKGTLQINKCNEILKERLKNEVYISLKPLHVKKNILYIGVTSSLISQEVMAISNQLLEEINKLDETSKITSIRFKNL